MIQVKNLCKKFGTVVAVDNINFTCNPGEVFGLLGANGAGKTTTTRILSTILKPTSGTALVNDYDIVSESEQVRKNIGVLSGDMGLYHRLTAEENVRYFGELHGLSRNFIDQRMDELFDLLDMQEYRKRRTDEFSKGMKQKVNIVRAILHDPGVLLFDEPTAGLDVMSARSVLEFIEKCKQQDKSILFSSHIMSEVERLCDRIAVLNQGIIIAEGTKAELLSMTGQTSLEEAFVRLVGVKHVASH
jgi:sodium transport system ATP-binding protein